MLRSRLADNAPWAAGMVVVILLCVAFGNAITQRQGVGVQATPWPTHVVHAQGVDCTYVLIYGRWTALPICGAAKP